MSLRYAVLGLLTQESGSGYDLLKRFESTVAHVWPATQSQLYTELNKLAQDGLVEVAGTGARNRKEYAVTEAGKQSLRDWLRHPSREIRRDTALLQVFLLSEVGTDEVRGFFVEMEQRARAKRDELVGMDCSIAWDESSRDKFSRMALEYGIRQARAELEWARQMQHLL